jgi:ABC-2 type transport system permease protein
MLFKRELKRNWKSALATSLICSALSVYVISLGPSFGKDIQQILDLKLPQKMQIAFGMTGLDYSDITSFFAISFSYIYLFFSIYVSSVFAVIVAKEFNEKTAEYLFALPAKRINIILIKLSVAFIYAVLTVVIVFLASWLSFVINIKDGYDMKPVALMALAWLIGGLAFGSLAFMLSSFFTKTRTVTYISIGLVLAFYLFQVVISVNEELKNLKYISPFDWFKGSEIANTGEISITCCLIAIALTVVSLFIGISRFRKIDVLV